MLKIFNSFFQDVTKKLITGYGRGKRGCRLSMKTESTGTKKMLLDILILAGFGFFLYHAVILLKNLILFLVQPFLCGLAGACLCAFPAWCIEYSILNATPYTLVAAGAGIGFVIGFVVGLLGNRNSDSA